MIDRWMRAMVVALPLVIVACIIVGVISVLLAAGYQPRCRP